MTTQPSESGAAADSCLRLAFNFAPATQRERLQAACALRDAVLSSAHTSEERQVCETQLAWWRDELHRVAAGEPRHPLARQFHGCAELDRHSLDLMLEWAVLAERLLDEQVANSVNDWRIRAFRMHGTVLLLTVATARRDELVHGFRDCAIAIATLDQGAASGSPDNEAEIDALCTGLATCAAGSDHVALGVLARLLTDALETQRISGKTAGAFGQLLTAWRTARACRKRSQNRSAGNP